MAHRSSFSQHNLFCKCNRMWFYQYVRRVPVISDMCYAYAGGNIHKILQFYYNGNKDRVFLKQEFERQWKTKKLDQSKIRLKEDEYLLMCYNGFDLNLDVTSTELKIYYPDVVAFLDIVNTTKDEIVDWKSSTRRPENEIEYKQQLMLYAYLYHLKFKRLPKKCSVYYLKYTGTKGVLSFSPTDKDLFEIEDWYYSNLKKMEMIIASNKIPPKCEECFIFCPFKNICEDNTDALKYTLHLEGNYIFLDGVITSLLHKGLTNKFSYELKNSFFIKKANPHINTTINFWNLKKRLLPIGFKDSLVKTLNDYAKYKKKELALDVVDNREFDETVVKMPEKFVNDKVLREYQTEAVDKFIRQKIGILEIGTGGGKTEIAIEVIRRLGFKTLFIVDKIELLKQTKKRIEDTLGIEVGTIGMGVSDIKDITVATIQTLYKNIMEYSKYLQTVRVVFFDETHKVAAKSYFKLGHHLKNTEYRMGISGTAFRDDGNDMMINATAGDIIYKMSSKTLIDEGWLVMPTIKFIKNYMSKEAISRFEANAKIGLINESMEYGKYYEQFISSNTYRNDLVCELIKENDNKKILILTKLVDHGKFLEESIPNSKHLFGGTSEKDREEIFKNFVDGKISVLISTISIFAEGIDIPSLDIVINASANKGDVKSIQVLGRVLRTLKGKKDAYYYDFIDETKFFVLASLARVKAFRKEGHEVTTIDKNRKS